MHRLIEQLSTAEFNGAHPALQASYAHYGIAAVHPFQDGNGRVARAVASTFFYRDLSLPLVVLVDHRDEYLGALSEADDGKQQQFIRFVFNRGLDAIELVLDALEAAGRPSADEAASRLRDLLAATPDLSHEQVDDLCWSLAQRFGSQVQNEAAARLPAGVALSMEYNVDESPPEVDGYRGLVKYRQHQVALRLVSNAPASGQEYRTVHPLVAVDRTNPLIFQLVEARGWHGWKVRLDEVHPEFTPTCQLRIQGWATEVLSEMLSSVAQQAEEALRAAGYTPPPPEAEG